MSDSPSTIVAAGEQSEQSEPAEGGGGAVAKRAAGAKGPRDEDTGRTRGTRVCDKCGSRFSGDARFCPFDAEPLVAAPDTRRPRDPLLGTIIDSRYEVETVLGEGGMGTVYRVTHRVLGRALALKVLRADLSREEELGLRFLREARAAASISHPNVVQITDFGTLPSGQPYFVMELLHGESLSSVLRRGGPLPPARAVRLVRQMVEGLSAAHIAGVVHRDLKPDNILVSVAMNGTESLKILDFGLAKVAGSSRLTKAGVVFGTPHYMSPEQASGKQVDERTDIYALGIVLYEMFTGKVPFESDTYMGVLTKHLYVAPAPPSVVLGAAHGLGALEQLTLRCLEKKPERRYDSMRALGDAIGRLTRFDENGALVVKPVVLGEPGAAYFDGEPSRPSSIRDTLSRRRPASESAQATFMVAAAAFLGLFAVALVALLSRGTAGSAATVPSLPVAEATARSASALRPPAPARLANDRGAADPAAPARPALTGKELPARAPQVASKAEPLQPSKESRPKAPAAPRSDATAKPVKSPTNHKKLGNGEIVDPWG